MILIQILIDNSIQILINIINAILSVLEQFIITTVYPCIDTRSLLSDSKHGELLGFHFNEILLNLIYSSNFLFTEFLKEYFWESIPMESYIFNLFYFENVSFVIFNISFDSSVYVLFSKNFAFLMEYTFFDENYRFNYDSFLYSNNNINKDFLISRWEKCFELKNIVNFKDFF